MAQAIHEAVSLQDCLILSYLDLSYSSKHLVACSSDMTHAISAQYSSVIQDLRYELNIIRERGEKSSDLAERHQKAVAKLTADNVVQLLRLKQCEAGLATVGEERDRLRRQVAENEGPWFEEATSCIMASCRLATNNFCPANCSVPSLL